MTTTNTFFTLVITALLFVGCASGAQSDAPDTDLGAVTAGQCVEAADCGPGEWVCTYYECQPASAAVSSTASTEATRSRGCTGKSDTASCEGDTLVSCFEGESYREDCTAHNLTCGANGTGGVDCISVGTSTTTETPMSECPATGETGVCDGSVRVYCLDGRSGREECRTQGKTCQASGGVAICVDPSELDTPATTEPAEPAEPAAGGSCGGETGDGRCDGETLVYCDDNGSVVRDNCTEFGLTCADDGSGWRDCVEADSGGADSNGCDGQFASSSCSGNTLNYCVQGFSYTQDCAASGQTCQAIGGIDLIHDCQ